MNIKPIGVEEWLNELETSATLDIAQSTIASLTTDEILALADDEAFCRKLLATRGVLLVPGSRFELPCGARLGYCAQEETLRRGLDELSCALRELD